MPQYVLFADHTPDLCPSSNAKVRARALDGLSPDNVEKVAEALGMKFVLSPLHLDPSHRTLAVIEAPAIEAVNKWVIETGMFQWNTVEVSAVTTIDEMMPIVMSQPVVFT